MFLTAAERLLYSTVHQFALSLFTGSEKNKENMEAEVPAFAVAGTKLNTGTPAPTI